MTIDDRASRLLVPIAEALDQYRAGSSTIESLYATVHHAVGASVVASDEIRSGLTELDKNLDEICSATAVVAQPAAVEAATAWLAEFIDRP